VNLAKSIVDAILEDFNDSRARLLKTGIPLSNFEV